MYSLAFAYVYIYMIKGGLLLQLRKVISLVKSEFSLLLTPPILFGGDELSETLFCMPLPLTVPHVYNICK